MRTARSKLYDPREGNKWSCGLGEEQAEAGFFLQYLHSVLCSEIHVSKSCWGTRFRCSLGGRPLFVVDELLMSSALVLQNPLAKGPGARG